jgi:4-aminobutyrate aminotransferase-like enzyme
VARIPWPVAFGGFPFVLASGKVRVKNFMLPLPVTEIPGPRSRELAGKLRGHESRNVTFLADDFPVFWQRAAGTNVWDADGNRFLDLTSAFGVAGLGHTNEAIRAALVAQSGELLHAMGDVHPSVGKVELCARLSELTFERWGLGGGKVILGNSGSDAVEAALKTSLLHSGKPGVIAFTGSYHGLGLGALSTTEIAHFREPFRAQLREFAAFLPFPHCFRCPFGAREDFRIEGRDFPNCSTPCLEKLHDEIERTIAQREIGCILVEPVQGRGGCVVPPRDFLPMLRTICDTHKILLVADEIYTGFNRTGALFACDLFQTRPDLICLGKALTGGFPLSACVGRADIMDAWPPTAGEALHTSTFLGNPLGCAMALASIAQHADPAVAGRVRERGAKLKGALLALRSPHIGNVRGLGLKLGVELVKSEGSPFGALGVAIMKQALRDGLILLPESPDANVISLCPPFSISDEEIAFAAARLQEYLTLLPGSIS